MNKSMRKMAGNFVTGSVFVSLMLFGASGAWSQQKAGNLKKQVVGMWSLVSAENTSADGKKSYPFGEKPTGVAVLDANGRFVILNINPAVPKIASNNRATATPEENKAIVAGSLGLFGTYTVNEAEKALVWRVEASTFSNWVGQEQKRPINSVTANELKWTNPASSVGAATTLLVWKRVK
jgi:hypothetical protein